MFETSKTFVDGESDFKKEKVGTLNTFLRESSGFLGIYYAFSEF
jgi:hypothetical protein